MGWKVVLTDHVVEDPDLERAALAAIGADLVRAPSVSATDLAATVTDADALLVCYAEIRAPVIAQLKCCRIIARLGIGVNNIDIAAATDKGIKVTNVPDYCIDEVSDHALALILAMARKIVSMTDSVTRGRKWRVESFEPIFRLRGKSLGLIGFGRIARSLAQKVQALGLNVLVYDPYVPKSSATSCGVEFTELDDLLHAADFVSVHAPLTEDTKHLLGASQFEMMKSTAYLVNTSRGGIVDEAALTQALAEKTIAGAALDVLEEEIFDPANPLLDLPNVLITPHAAFYSKESSEELRRKAVTEIVRVLQGDPPRYPVNQVVQPEQEQKASEDKK